MNNLIYFLAGSILIGTSIFWYLRYRKQRERVVELEAFLQQIPGGIFAYTADEREELGIISEGLWKLFGYDSEAEFRAAVKNRFSRMVHPEDRAEALASIDAQVEDSVHDKLEYRIVTKSGEVRWVYDCGHLVEGTGKQKMFFVSILDNTELKAAQEQLRQAQFVSDAKGSFLSRVSHEIRTPLNAVIGLAEIAQTHFDDRGKVQDCLRKISLSSDHLLQLINDVLDMSKIESGRIEIQREPFTFGAWIETVRGLFAEQARQRGLRYEVRQTGAAVNTLLGDSLRLNQVIYNLLSNAFKFTPAGKRVTLTVEVMPQESGVQWIAFSVADEGRGIEEKHFDKIFETFRQEDGKIEKDYGGTGLGLPISKKLVELMGGEIRLRSALGKGSTFTVCLPFEPTAQSVPGQREEQAPDCRGWRVLVVDDNEINREIAAEFIGQSGATIDMACDGAEAVEKFAASPSGAYAMIFMDIHMPVLDGYEATACIRAMTRPDAQTTPIFAMTADAFLEDIQKSKACGMNAHISKPLRLDVLYALMRRALCEREEEGKGK